MPGERVRDAAEEDGDRRIRSHDAYRSAVALALLVLLWGIVNQILAPPLLGSLERVGELQTWVAGAGLAYFASTWRRPVLHVAVAFSLLEILIGAVLILGMGWTRPLMGRQWQPVAAAQLALASVPLVAPGSLWVGCALVGLFAAEVVIIFEHQVHLGLAIAAAEPYLSLAMVPVGIGVLVMREQRRKMAVAYVRTQSETATLTALRPLFSSVREQLRAQLSTPWTGGHDRLVERSLLRLEESDAAISALEMEPAVETAATAVGTSAEQLLLARDAQTGASLFAIAALGVTAIALRGFRNLPLGSTLTVLWVAGGVYAATLVWLLLRRRVPSSRRGVVASLLLFAAAAFVTAFAHVHWVHLRQPADPFIGHKLMIVGMVLIRPVRLWLGVMFVALLGVEAVALHLLLRPALGQSPLEPWHTLLFVGLGVGLLLMGEQRRIASLTLLRAETVAASQRRRASLFLALCDQLNSPLQTLLLRLEVLQAKDPSPANRAQLGKRIALIRTLSRQLQQLTTEIPSGLHQASLDSAVALQARR